MFSEASLEILRCPHCAREKEGRLALTADKQALVCQETGCGREYPIVDGLPVMLTEEGDFLGYRKKIIAER